MRLDKYLKISRLIKRRTVANEACDNGRVTLNGRVARASAEVKPGDIISSAIFRLRRRRQLRRYLLRMWNPEAFSEDGKPEGGEF